MHMFMVLNKMKTMLSLVRICAKPLNNVTIVVTYNCSIFVRKLEKMLNFDKQNVDFCD